MITIRSWGIAGSVVDGGRVGQLWLGKPRGGAVDLESLRLANRLVGNREAACAVESSGGLSLEFGQNTTVAITGAIADVTVSAGAPVGWGSVATLPPNCTLHIGRLLDGSRVYVAVRGGVLGGTEVGQRGDQLMVGHDESGQPLTEALPRPSPSTTVGLWPGPRRDWFDEQAWTALCSSAFVVAATSRVGVRLSGHVINRSWTGELASEGVIEGAVQVPPDGQPIVMLADHPTTGGYPVIGVVSPGDIGHIAQAAVGTELRFSARR